MGLRFLILMFFSGFAHAAGPINPLSWYKPFFFMPPAANYVSVAIFGRTNPRSSVAIDTAQIVTANPINDMGTETGGQAKILTTVADQNGEFKINLKLPLGFVQMPVEITSEKAVKNVYIVTLEVQKDKVNLGAKTEPDSENIALERKKLQEFIEVKYGLGLPMNARLKGLWLGLAVGMNYQIHSQSLGGSTKLDYESLSYPSLGLHSSYATEKWLFKMSYGRTPGSVSSSTAPFTLDKKNFVWTTTLLEAGVNSSQETYREKMRLTYLIGMQQHFTPHFRPEFGNIIKQQEIQTTTIGAGGQVWAQMTNKVLFEVLLRYQYPMTASSRSESGFSVKPQFAFDGSLGLYYEFKAKRFISLNWFGQWHKYKFNFTDASDPATASGTQSLFYTNLDLRYVMQF